MDNNEKCIRNLTNDEIKTQFGVDDIKKCMGCKNLIYDVSDASEAVIYCKLQMKLFGRR